MLVSLHKAATPMVDLADISLSELFPSRGFHVWRLAKKNSGEFGPSSGILLKNARNGAHNYIIVF